MELSQKAGHTEQAPRRVWPPRRKGLLAWAELAGLWTIVFSQQAFERIASGPEAYTSVGADRLDILLVILLVAVVPPTLGWVVEMAIYRLRSPQAATVFHAALFGVAVGLFYWQFAVRKSIPTVPRYLPALLFAGGGGYLYLRTKFIKYFAELLSLATPVVVVMFVISYPTIDQLLPQRQPPQVERIKSDTPVVLVVFDEFSLDNLLDKQGKIDARLFPNFARLAQRSTWYPNAQAVSPSTLTALPAIVTGKLPEPSPSNPEQPPVPSPRNFPANLCTILQGGGYEIHAIEPITQFCNIPHPHLTRIQALISRTLVSGILPPNSLLPRISEFIDQHLPEPTSTIAGDRKDDLNRFISGIYSSPRTFNFAHSLLPHSDWSYLPDGESYEPDLREAPFSRSRVARDFTFQQVMLQTGFVDSEVGRLVAEMEDKQIWDKSLVVVTADHGLDLSFADQPIHRLTRGNTRNLSPESAGALLPIPLFVKLPGQAHGRVVRSDVRSVDIAPTILKQLGITLPDSSEIDGKPLGNGGRDSSGPIVARGTAGLIKTTRRQYATSRKAAQRLRNRLFGSGSFFALGGRVELLGTAVSANPELVPWGSQVKVSPESSAEDPASLAGRWEFTLKERPPDPSQTLAIAVSGTVVATAMPWFDQENQAWMASIVLPDTAFSSDGSNEVELYLVPSR